MVPDFANNQRLREFSLYSLAEAAPKVVRNLICHIQPPTVHTGLSEPVQCHIGEIGCGRRAAQIHLWHTREIAEALVIVRTGSQTKGKLIHIVPVFIY